MTEKEKIIQGYMKSLDLSREEAEELYACDFEDAEQPPEVEELTKKAKANVKNYVSTEKKRNTGKRERKVDNIKLAILQPLIECLPKEAEGVQLVNEKEITFSIDGTPYTLRLIRHKKK